MSRARSSAEVVRGVPADQTGAGLGDRRRAAAGRRDRRGRRRRGVPGRRCRRARSASPSRSAAARVGTARTGALGHSVRHPAATARAGLGLWRSRTVTDEPVVLQLALARSGRRAALPAQRGRSTAWPRRPRRVPAVASAGGQALGRGPHVGHVGAQGGGVGDGPPTRRAGLPPPPARSSVAQAEPLAAGRSAGAPGTGARGHRWYVVGLRPPRHQRGQVLKHGRGRAASRPVPSNSPGASPERGRRMSSPILDPAGVARAGGEGARLQFPASARRGGAGQVRRRRSVLRLGPGRRPSKPCGRSVRGRRRTAVHVHGQGGEGEAACQAAPRTPADRLNSSSPEPDRLPPRWASATGEPPDAG